MRRLTTVVLLLGLVLSLENVHKTFGSAIKNERFGDGKITRIVPRRSAMLPQDGNMGLAMQSRAVDTRVQLSVKEGEPVGTLIGTIPVQQNFTYRFNEPIEEFILDGESGEIRTGKILDRESLNSGDKFDLVVLSSQPTHPIEVRIHVIDINDNDPEFPESSIAVSFSESAAAGTKLLLDSATDKDTPENGVVDDYFIVGGNTENKFRLDVTGNPSGESSYLHLETTGKLDREQVEFYSLNVCVRDRGKPPRVGYLLVNVTVLDVNDNPPIFHQSDYIVALNESVPVGTNVLTVKATDKDTDDNSKLTYYLPDSEEQFTINPESGLITTAEPELNCPPQQSCTTIKPGSTCPKSCVITVFARDHGSPRQNGRTYVTVNLLDANDHDPEIKFNYFPTTVGFATVDENAIKNSLVAAVAVIDNDEGLNGETTVEIKSGNELGHFKLDNSQSFDYVRVNGKLDREEIPIYNLTIVATDKGTPPRSATAYLVIHVNDVNDHDPVFQQSEYSAVLSELSPIGTFVASISASDADSGLNARIYYYFDSGNEQSWFSIDQDTGLVTTISKLDREIQGSIELRVTARDGGPNPRYASTHLRVTILDENDEAPKFTQDIIQVNLSENTPSHSLIATLVAIDNDQGTNGSISYTLHPSVFCNYPKTFALDALTGQLTTLIKLDREIINEYNILIIAKDQGIPPQSSTATVLLTIDDVNDNSPIFYPKKYFISLSEDTLPGTSIGKVTATDIDSRENAKIKYFLESGGKGLFTVDEKTGEIILQGSLRLAQQKILYQLIISARDNGDREAIENAIVEIIREEDLEHLDFDNYNGYEFKISEDYGDCRSTTTTTNNNNNGGGGDSTFDKQVGTVMISQYTSSKIIYSIVYGDPNGIFKINENNGVISTANCLDREKEAYYSLHITAKAGTARGTTFVNITILDVNDNSPKFPKGEKIDQVYLKENAAVGQEIYLARARDKDIGANARITYTLTHNPGNQFRIADNSGIIYLDKPIRSLPGTILNVEVTAVDTGIHPLSAQQQIKIIIEDVNDHTPVFKLTSYEISLLESTPVNERFFILRALDSDLDDNGKILYSVTNGNDENRFGIFPDGQLYVKHILDREKQDYYALEVTASDQGKPKRSSIVPVVVHIIDENDNPPQFTNSSFIFHIRENEPPDTFVGKLLATDKDVGRNADLTFSLPMTQQDFVVDPRNGFIKSLHIYDREELVANTGSNFINLEAIVNDNGINRLKDKVKVTIYINDVNDNPPLFQRMPYKVQISEGAAIGTQLLRVYTSDADEGLNGDVFYSLENGNKDGKFIIDEATGQISLARELDREKLDNYLLTVVAYDAGLEIRLSSSATVNIDILDENDNPPKFINNQSKILLIETTPINSELLKFKATDDDLDTNSELTFAITAGNRRDTFYIDPLTGILYLKKSLDYEELDNYILNITCSDGGHPRMSSTTTLIVQVIDANDNPPAFPNTAIVRQIREGITIKTPVHSVTAEDPDSGDNGAVTYSIITQYPIDQKRYFGINHLTGVIHTLLPIDREEIDTFKLTVVATDKAQPPSLRLSAEKLVIVIVEDLNDNAPVFVSMSAVVLPNKSILNANLGKEIPVATVLARDLDSSTNGLVTYELMRTGNYSDMFRLHRSTGVLTMKLPRSLNHMEKLSRYHLGVRATDEAVQAERRSSETTVTLIVSGDINNKNKVDNDKPYWDHSNILEGSVYENEPIGTSILKVSARTHKSGCDIEYYVTNITAGHSAVKVDRLFDIDVKSGLLQTSVSLDRENGIDWYQVEIYAIVIGGNKPSTSFIKAMAVYNQHEYLDMLRVYHQCLDQAGMAARIYAEEYPLRRHPDGNVFQRLEYRLRGGEGLVPGNRGNGRIANLADDDAVLNFIHDNPETSTRRCAAPFNINHMTVHRLIKRDGLHPYHFTKVQYVEPGDDVSRVDFCHWYQQNAAANEDFAKIIMWSDESTYTREGIFNIHNSHYYSHENPYAKHVNSYQHKFSVGVWAGLFDNHVVRVTVLDKNDLAPSWAPGPWKFQVSEEAPPNTIVTTLVAYDPDTIGNLRYSLIKKSHHDYDETSNDLIEQSTQMESQFKLDPITGQLRLIEALDRETKEKYVLRVRADDGLQHTDINLIIQVTDTNDNVPVFQSTVYSFDIEENVPRGSRVGQVIATDADAHGPNSKLTYALISDWANDVFSLNPNTGVFTLTASLDYEQIQHYILVVQATDGGLPALSTTVTVYCNVVDLNDNAPIFESGPHDAEIFENVTIGTNVLSIIAQDLDSGDNGRVVYDITSGDVDGSFGIASNGTIFTRKLLDRESKSIYNLIIKAKDSPKAPTRVLSSSVQVTIVLLDVNDMSPEFISPNQTSVVENSPLNTVVMAIKAIDKDEGRNGYVEYYLEKNNSFPFNVGAVDGLLRVSGPLDRELNQNYSIKITAKDRGEFSKLSSTIITVNIIDENDNSPIFNPKQYSATVAENASIGASVLQVSASDKDEGANGRVRYTITLGDENRDFTISEDGGVIRVAKNLNFERKSRYRLTVKAEDCSTEIGELSRDDVAEVTITVLDINDNAPVFLDSPYLAQVMENMVPPSGGFVIPVKAYDADTPPFNDQVRYFLKEGDTDLFKINASTGDVFLLRPLDREMLSEYTLTLVAMDTGSPPLTGSGILKVVVLDVNDHNPEFTRPDYKASVMENSPAGTWVAKPIATDKDEGLNAKIKYSLLGDKVEFFSVNPDTGEVTTLVPLDREQTSVYHLTLVAQDSSPTEPRATAVNLTIFVQDLNDNTPKFSSPRYTAYVPDSTKPGDFVFGAKATDNDEGENSRIVYELQGEDSNYFVIDSSNGVIRAMKELSQGKATYQLQIRASDCGTESQSVTADLIIHLWERELFPSFRSNMNTKFTLSEDVPEGRIITTLSASTPKNGAASNLIFAMAGGNVGDALRIDPNTGDVLVASGFDYETTPNYEAWVEVKDSDKPPLRSVVQLLINVTDANDNSPVMEAIIYNATVLEEEYPPLFVTKVSAKDLDSGENGQITYYLLNNYDQTFVIDENTGEISTNSKLDREEISFYELIVEAQDQGEPRLSGTATVLVTVLDKNDNPPKFTRLFSVNVTENAEIGSFVIKITSSDQDIGQNSNVSYSFTENPSGKFSIDSTTGIIQVIGRLDREEQDEYLLKVIAADGAWIAETTLTITIQDQNDNEPEFLKESYHFNFPEMQRKLAHVGQVIATDRDKQGPNSVISYSLFHPSDLFSVDPATGDIFSKKTLRYRHTNQPLSPENLYTLTVVASDNGKPPLSSKTLVHVNVVDANNNPPRFEQRTYLSPVPERFDINKPIVQLIAKDDCDFGVNAEIEYSIQSGNGSNYFEIDSKTGWIYITKNIKNIPIGTNFLINVEAIDKGVPPQKDQVPLNLIITGENKYTPTFAAVSYQVRVPENEPINTTILTVSAVDLDSGPNGMIRYKISSDNNKNIFYINPITGAITILESLDYDSIQEYRLNITATDLGFESKQAVATVTVNVSDINDNPPIFNQSLYHAYLPENLQSKSFVYKVIAKDIDSQKYSIIQYRIIGGSGKDYFYIQQETGVITSKISFDYEEANEYTLDIVAANPDLNSQMVGFTTVLVHITGINEYYPKFIQPVFHLDISESAEVGTSVGLVQATDQDLGEDGKVYYLFVGSSNDKGFSIGTETGIISVSRHLDRETQNRAILTVMAKNVGGIRGNDTDEAQVIISIQDGNDPPEFLQSNYEASVSEGANLGSKILTVRAIDKDVKPQNNQFSYSIIAGNINQGFKIDPQSGDVETAKMLDRESISMYELIIGAIDTGSPPQTGTAVVRINLLDINDNGPTFEPSEIIGHINENEPAGTSIMTLMATDSDLPPNGAPFTYRLIGGRYVDVVTLDKHSGVLKTTRSLDREVMPQFDLLIEVEDSGTPRMKSEHTVTIIVSDENDSPSTSRSVHVMVHSLNGDVPMGKIADVHPNDPDTTGDYTCKILQGSNPGVLNVPIACDLHTSKITPGSGYSLSISGNDGRHPDVVSKVTVEFIIFSNATIENSVTLKINRLTASEFLSKYYRPLLDMLQQDLTGGGDTFTIYSIGESDGNVHIYLAMETTQGFKPKYEVIELLSRVREKIQDILNGNSITIGYSPCKYMACDNGGSCSDQLVIYKDARIINSQSLILTSPTVEHEMLCKCRDGFTGNRCERRQDPCSPNPCLLNGQCRRIGYDFICSCPSNREGKLCELERGDICASNPCRNGGSCKLSPDGSSFFCLCKAGYRGNHCEAITDSCRPNPCLNGGLCVGQKPGYKCSCPEGRYGRHCERSTFSFDELSYMSFPSLDSNTNDITIIFATTKSDALLLYNYGPQSGGRSDFIVLELINGRIAFSYGGARSAITFIKIERGNRLDDGHWRKITATRNGRVVSLSVSNCKENGDICNDCIPGDGSCYIDDVGSTSSLNFNNNPLFLGGLISADPVLERPGQIHSDDLVGCVHSVSINGRALNLSNPLSSRGIKNTCPRSENFDICSYKNHDIINNSLNNNNDNNNNNNKIKNENNNLIEYSVCGYGNKCYDKWHQVSCQCNSLIAPNCHSALEPINLMDGGYIEFKISEKHRRMQLLEYLYGGSTSWLNNRVTRATKDNYNLLASSLIPPKKISLMFRTNKPDGILIYAATDKHYTSIELRNGQLSYSSLLDSLVNMTGSIEGGLADGNWHNLTIFAHSRGVEILIDSILTGDELDSAGVHDFLDPYLTGLFIGGVGRDLYYAHDGVPNFFEGCLVNFTINNEIQPFNGSGSIFKDVITQGKVIRGCRGLVGVSAATVADPLSIGITVVIVFFVILTVAILVIFIVFRLRRQNKEKSPNVNKNTNAIITGNTLGSGNDGLMSRHENTYISDTSDLRGVGHIGPELISKKYKEREITNTEHRSQRPDIIEREVTKSPPIRDEHPPLPPPTQSLHSHEHNNELDMPEHYDLENASSIAPSDIDIVYHYQGYRDGGMRKYKATPPPIGNYTNHHKHTGTPHRHAGPIPPRTMPPPTVGKSSGPTPKLLQSTPLARLSPSSELSAQQPRILTLHDISGKPLQSALLATTSSSGGVGKDALNSNSERSLNSPIMSQLSGSTASRKVTQSNNENGNNVSTGPMGLTAEEIERLNSRPRTSSLVSTLDAVSSSSEARGPPPPPHGPLHLHRRHTPPQERLERRASSTTDESGNDSFTCSEIEYDSNSLGGDKRSENLYSKPNDEQVTTRNNDSPQSKKPPNGNYDGFNSSFRGSLSTLVASDDDLSTHMGSLYRPNNNGSPSTNTALSWDYLLNWGPNFENLVGVFIDIAELPDSNNRTPSTLRLSSNIPKTSEEYV